MGFGVLCFGTLLLFNVVYYRLTDIIMAAILLYGLYKLSQIGKTFKFSYFSTYGFLALSLAELALGALELFDPLFGMEELTVYTSALRAIALGLVLIPLLLGMGGLGRELEVRSLADRCRTGIFLTVLALGVTFIASMPPLLSLFGDKVQLTLYLISLLGQLLSASWVFLAVYKSYANICMPENNTASKQKTKKDK